MADAAHILVNRVLAAARRYPDRPALQFHDRVYSYSELLSVAAAYAEKIAALEDTSPVVALLAEHSIEAYAGLLGILLAGKGYMPLNPKFPENRNHFMLEKSGARTMIAGRECQAAWSGLLTLPGPSLDILLLEGSDPERKSLPQHHKVHRINTKQAIISSDLATDPGSTADLLFTSGSTGVPKGVAVANKNVCAYLDNLSSLFGFLPEDRFTQTFDLTFDLSVHDIFVCWTNGACLCIPDDNSSFGLSRYLRAMQPTVWFSVPSVAVLLQRMRLLKSGSFPWLRLSFFCGEALLLETAAAWAEAAANSELVNLYGPTEATIAVSAYSLPLEVKKAKSLNGIVSIGTLFPGHELILSDEEDGKGMLCIGGPQVVDGYFRDQELTEKYFFRAGTPSLAFYNTGDLVRKDPDGDLFFLGRADAEVKISGYRVNLLEIDHVIASLENVKQAVTLYLPSEGKDPLLVSFVVPYEKIDDIYFVLEHCGQKLPRYMVPEKIIFVEDIPLNANGKTDRQALSKRVNDHDG